MSLEQFLTNYHPKEENAYSLDHLSEDQLTKLASPLLQQNEYMQKTASAMPRRNHMQKISFAELDISPEAWDAAGSLTRSIKLAREFPRSMGNAMLKTAASKLTVGLLSGLAGGAAGAGIGYGVSKRKDFTSGVLKTPGGVAAVAGPRRAIKRLARAIKNKDVKGMQTASKRVAILHPGYTYRANVTAAARGGKK